MTQPTESCQQVRATLLRCWSEILDVPYAETSDSSNFFFDGGNSLLAVHLVSAVSSELGVEIPLESLFLDGSFGALLKATTDAVSAGQGGG
jgi:acyl carrier protein